MMAAMGLRALLTQKGSSAAFSSMTPTVSARLALLHSRQSVRTVLSSASPNRTHPVGSLHDERLSSFPRLLSVANASPFGLSSPALMQVRWNRNMRKKQREAVAKAQKEGKIIQPKVSKEMQNNFQRLMTRSPGAILDPYIPASKADKPALLSMDGIRYRLRSAGKMMRSTVSVGVLKRKLKVFDPIAFAQEAQEIYLLALEAISKDDRAAIDNLITPNAILKLKGDFRGLNGFKVLDTVERPQCVYLNAFATGGNNNQNYFAQVTVRVHVRTESIAGPIASMPGDGGNLLDYVVMERYIESGPNSADMWKICGRIDPKNPPKVPAHMQRPPLLQRLTERFRRKKE